MCQFPGAQKSARSGIFPAKSGSPQGSWQCCSPSPKPCRHQESCWERGQWDHTRPLLWKRSCAWNHGIIAVGKDLQDHGASCAPSGPAGLRLEVLGEGSSSMISPSTPHPCLDPCIPPAILQILLEDPTRHPGNCLVPPSFSFSKC